MKKLTTEEFVLKAKLIYGDKYDYSNTSYTNSYSNIMFICKTHGEVVQRPYNHLNGSGCPKCAVKNITNDIFTLKANKKHDNQYNYSLIEIKKVTDKIKIICPIHGVFTQKAASHLSGFGCKKCSSDKNRSSSEIFINKAKDVHGEKYSYLKTNYINKRIKVIITCKIHGDFEQRCDMHLRGSGCNKCKMSKGEIKISNYLTENNINFISQYKFQNCKNIKPLPFDFYLPDYNACIEYQGIQHYEPISHFGGEKGLEETQKRDKLKKEYCHDNNIPFLTISYKEKIIEKIIKFLI